MRLPFTAIIAAILHVVFCLPAATIAADDKGIENFVLMLLRERVRTLDLSVITPEKKEAVVALLRDIATGKRQQIGSVHPNHLIAKVILLRLGDPPTMHDSAATYLKTGFLDLDDIRIALQPALIPLLADGFRFDARDDAAAFSSWRGSCTRPVSPTFRATLVIRELLAGCPQFTVEMRAWAKALHQKSIPSQREVLRVWWKQNEAFFKTGDYKSVRPPIPQAATEKNP